MNNINISPKGVEPELHKIIIQLFGEEIKYPTQWFVDPEYLEIKPEEY